MASRARKALPMFLRSRALPARLRRKVAYALFAARHRLPPRVATAYLSSSRPTARISGVTQRSEPIFNVPAAVMAVIVACVLVHLARTLFAHRRRRMIDFLAHLRVHSGALRSDDRGATARCRAGWAADVWTFVTYAFIHGDADASRRQPRVAAAVRHRGRAPVRQRALPRLLRRRRRPPARLAHLVTHPGADAAGDRRVGGDLRVHGGGDRASRSSAAGRSAVFAAATDDGLSGAGRAAHDRVARRAHRRVSRRLVRPQSPVRLGHARGSRLWIRRSRGRRISAASSPACCCSRCSIRSSRRRRRW